MGFQMFAKTLLGRWAVGLAAVFLLGYLVAFIASLFTAVDFGLAGSFFGLALGAAGGAAFPVGMVSIIKSGERSVLVYLSLAVGLYALAFFAVLIWLTFFGGTLINLGGF